METNFNFNKTTIHNMTVELKSQENFNLEVLHGKVLVSTDDHLLFFIQNKPRGNRSQEVMRTAHSRLVRRPDGSYTLTFRFGADEPNVLLELVSEMMDIAGNNMLNL